MGIIYKVTNMINKKVYIGKTIFTLEKRKNDHIKQSKFKSTSYFHKALNKYNFNNFIWEILEETNNLEDREKYYIKLYNSTNNLLGYNLTLGGEGSKGRVLSEETKNKISNANKGYKKRLGIKHTEKSKLQISNSKKDLCSLPIIKQEAIIKLYSTGAYSIRCIARNYNVSPLCINRIIKNGKPFTNYYRYQEIKTAKLG